jgi:UDP-N-acetylmuramate-alanine ligase
LSVGWRITALAKVLAREEARVSGVDFDDGVKVTADGCD